MKSSSEKLKLVERFTIPRLSMGSPKAPAWRTFSRTPAAFFEPPGFHPPIGGIER